MEGTENILTEKEFKDFVNGDRRRVKQVIQFIKLMEVTKREMEKEKEEAIKLMSGKKSGKKSGKVTERKVVVE